MSQATLHPERFLGESPPLTTHGEEQLCQGLLSFVLQSVRGNKSIAFCPRVTAERERPAGTSCGMQRKLNIYLFLLSLEFLEELLKTK